MKKFLFKIVLFILLLAICDVGVGYIGRYLSNHVKAGDMKQSNYVAHNVDAKILLMGSSRCAHHYDPEIIGEELGASCYNIGLDGNGIFLMYGRYKLVSERYTPQLIIYDVHYSFDVCQNDNHQYLQYLRPYYSDDNVRSIVNSVGANENIKMLSQCYRYNNQLVRLIANNIVSSANNHLNGYSPLDYDMKLCRDASLINEPKVDSLKLYYIEQLINECKGKTNLVFCTSPRYHQGHDLSSACIIELCKKYDIPFLDHYSDTTFTTKPELFADVNHLNKKGASLYSEMISKEIRKIDFK